MGAQKCCWNTTSINQIFLSCIDGSVKMVDLGNSLWQDVKKGGLLNGIFYSGEYNTLITVGYDSIVDFWDMRAKNSVNSYKHNEKIMVSDFQNTALAAGTAN